MEHQDLVADDLSLALRQRIREALVAVEEHPRHMLATYLRHHVYIALGPRVQTHDFADATDLSGYLRRSFLTIAAARWVLAIWEHAHPDDLRPVGWLAIADAVVQRSIAGVLSPWEREALMADVANPAWDAMAALAETALGKPLYEDDAAVRAARDGRPALAPDLFAGLAIARALQMVVSDLLWFWEVEHDVMHPAGGVETTDADIWVDHTDAAAFACWAEADVDPTRMLHFWTWWLLEAVPDAWRAIPPPPPYPSLSDGRQVQVTWAAEPWRAADDVDWVGALAFSPDGSELVVVPMLTEPRRWSLSQLDQGVVQDLPLEPPPWPMPALANWRETTCCAYSSDGAYLAAGRHRGGVTIWNRAGRVQGYLAWQAESTVQNLAFSSDSRWLVTHIAPDAVHLVDLQQLQGKDTPSAVDSTVISTSSEVADIALSPVDATLAVLLEDGTAQLWQRQEGDAPIETEDSLTEWWRLAHSFAAIPRRVNVDEMLQWSASPRCLFSPDGQRLVVRGPGAEGWIHLWEVSAREATWLATEMSARRGSPKNALAFSPDGQVLAVRDDDIGPDYRHQRPGVRLLDASSLAELAFFRCPDDWPEAMSFSPSGQFLAIGGHGGGSVWVWDLDSYTIVASFPAHADGWDVREGAPDSPLRHVVWSPAEEWIATSGHMPVTPNPNHVRPHVGRVVFAAELWQVRLNGATTE